MSANTILVTGAAGFAGRFVCAELRRLSIDYIGLDQRLTDDADADCHICDITDMEAVRRIFRTKKIDAVIHLAAILPSATRANPTLATRVNIQGGVNVIEAAGSTAVRRFVLASSMSVYGSEGNEIPLSEDVPPQPTDLYGLAKRYMEIYGDGIAQTHRLAFTAFRIASVVGPGARNTASPWRSQIFEKLGTGRKQTIGIPFRRGAILSLVHAEDLARMLILLARQASFSSTVYNTPAESWRVDELKKTLEALDGDLEVQLDETSRRRTPPVADGAKFARDFAYASVPLVDRLSKEIKQ